MLLLALVTTAAKMLVVSVIIGYQRNDMFKNTWLIKIGRDKSSLPKEDNIRICHVHSTEECFKRDLEVTTSYNAFCCKCFFEIPLSVA